MRDISRRLQRHRLSRYARPENPLRRGLPWAAVALVAWALWMGVVSDHSLWRIWRLQREHRQTERELARVEAELLRLAREAEDPVAQRRRAERWLREQGGMARPDEIIYRIQGAPSDSAE
uniref:Septum formation initiator family protein n=1 Tax=Eiseniibacteriota bacterium TaxID=2212470 RepID=A0A832I3D4_UNCEI